MKKIRHYFTALDIKLHQAIAEFRDSQLSRRIVIFESDDWGAIRVPSAKVHDSLVKCGYDLDRRPYEHLDGLECDQDVAELMKVLTSFKDNQGNHPIFTLNYLSANPDFDEIRRNDFKSYDWEPIDTTYRHYDSSANVIDLVKEGIKEGVFEVEFHGREHFDITKWLKDLQINNEDVLNAFSYNMCGIFPKDNPAYGNKYLVALNADDSFIRRSLEEGIREFIRIWGYNPKSFIAPCYTWNRNVEEVLAKMGIRIIQTSRFQRFPKSSRRKVHYMGESNPSGQVYTIRNCAFEPATAKHECDIVSNTLSEIRRVFESNKIAIISTHRINYTSRLSNKNAEQSRLLLSELLTKILSEFPNVEFSTGIKLYHK